MNSSCWPRIIFLTIGVVLFVPQANGRSTENPLKASTSRLIGAALTSDHAYNVLGDLCDNIGHRLSGSPQLDQAIEWAVKQMKKDGFTNVHKEPVMVPAWVRGKESAYTIKPTHHELTILGLGNSMGTPKEGITAQAIVVGSFDELEALGESKIKNKIVVYDVPFETYGKTVQYRAYGPSRAAALGAKAVLVRSVGPISYNTPHTGGLRYSSDESIPKIPAAAITIENATMLHRIQERGDEIRIHLSMEAHFEDDAPSANVVGEIRGSEIPEEVVLIGGHLDSWDVGQGAQDDGVGCVIAMEAARLIHELDLKPRRTIRVVLFTNEENGSRGAKAYAKEHAGELGNIVAAIESDLGNGPADGFGLDVRALVPDLPDDATDEEIQAAKDKAEATAAPIREKALEIARTLGELLEPLAGGTINPGHSGVDIGPMVAAGVTGLGLHHDPTKYFEIHHTHADTFEKIIPADLRRNVAIMAVMTYLLADMPGRLTPDRTGGASEGGSDE